MGGSPFKRQLNRVMPGLPVGAMQTYAITAPKETHWVPASCEEAACPAFLNGWETFVDEASDLGQRQADYIRKRCGKAFKEHRNEAGITVFRFDAGQVCFAAANHKKRTGRPELFTVRDGDWRGNPTGRSRVHSRPEDWVDDFATHQQTLSDRMKRG